MSLGPKLGHNRAGISGSAAPALVGRFFLYHLDGTS